MYQISMLPTELASLKLLAQNLYPTIFLPNGFIMWLKMWAFKIIDQQCTKKFDSHMKQNIETI